MVDVCIYIYICLCSGVRPIPTGYRMQGVES